MAYNRSITVETGFGLGTVIAAVVSWDHNHSILWAIIDGLLSWVYLVYALISY